MYVQLIRYNKSQFVLEMSTKNFDTNTKTSTPLPDCGIDDALIEFIPRGDNTFSQLTDVLHVMFVYLLLHHRPDFVVYRIKVRTVRGGQSVGGMKSGGSFNISTVSCMVRRSVILLKCEVILTSGAYTAGGWHAD